MSRTLKNKPLIEAILEIRWRLSGESLGAQSDPNYSILIGRLYDRLITDYPNYEQQPTARIPHEMVPYVAQHRFRQTPDGWPLIQVGPGLLTLNSTTEYEWSDFKTRAAKAIDALFAAHPSGSDLGITNMVLRYIDAVEIPPSEANATDFIGSKLKVRACLPDSLFEGTEWLHAAVLPSKHTSARSCLS
jgi:uncharacterized protein (TIGR04255 family)